MEIFDSQFPVVRRHLYYLQSLQLPTLKLGIPCIVSTRETKLLLGIIVGVRTTKLWL